jgi:hypothetical protein
VPGFVKGGIAIFADHGKGLFYGCLNIVYQCYQGALTTRWLYPGFFTNHT